MSRDLAEAIQIDVETAYLEAESDPDAGRYVFAYTITIHNAGHHAATLRRRHWLITDGAGRRQEVDGEGVVGEQPRLEPGESYRYTSGTMLETPVGFMEGKYRMVADDGTAFDADIPGFTLSVPNALH